MALEWAHSRHTYTHPLISMTLSMIADPNGTHTHTQIYTTSYLPFALCCCRQLAPLCSSQHSMQHASPPSSCCLVSSFARSCSIAAFYHPFHTPAAQMCVGLAHCTPLQCRLAAPTVISESTNTHMTTHTLSPGRGPCEAADTFAGMCSHRNMRKHTHTHTHTHTLTHTQHKHGTCCVMQPALAKCLLSRDEHTCSEIYFSASSWKVCGASPLQCISHMRRSRRSKSLTCIERQWVHWVHDYTAYVPHAEEQALKSPALKYKSCFKDSGYMIIQRMSHMQRSRHLKSCVETKVLL